MNYITQLTGFFRRAAGDLQLNPSHVSLYVALFQQWNLNRFRNPVSIGRGEVMRLSKIHSRVTYHKCIRELHSWGYLHYDPSYNHFRGSLVYMFDFGEVKETSDMSLSANFCTGVKPEVDGSWSGAGQELSPSINTLNRINTLNSLNGGAHARIRETEEEQVGERKEKGCAEKEKKTPPPQEEVLAFFKVHGQSEREALRFFHYYQATGWQMARVPIQDWKSAARKWWLRDLGSPWTPGGTGTGQKRVGPGGDYDEPL